MDKIDGRWEGRLIDAAGFEGEVALDLKSGHGEAKSSTSGKLSGSFEVSLTSHHGGQTRRGTIAGELRKATVSLTLVPSEKTDPKVDLKGDVFPVGEGLGLKGLYSVEPRKFSALAGGIMVVSNVGAHAPDVEVVRNTKVKEPPVGAAGRKATRKGKR